jgi:hypothetical protein
LTFEIVSEENEKRSFFYYRERTLQHLGSFQQHRFWDRLVVQASYSHEAIRRMVVAIGAFNEAVDHEDVEVSRQLQTLALEQYSRALEQTVSRIEIIAQEHLLIAALMFSFFESIRGHTLAALRQLYSAISALLRHWADERAIPVIEDDLRPILAFTHVRASALYPQILQIPAPLDGDLPQRFGSMHEAHLHFFAIAQRISTELDVEYRRSPISERSAASGPDFLARLNAWRVRFVEFINGPEPTCSCEPSQAAIHHRLGILFMQIQYLSTAIRLRAGVIASEMAFDSHIEDVKRMLTLQEQIVSLYRRPDYDGPAAARCLGFTPSVLPTLAMLGLRCRDPATRRRITAIIRSAGDGGNQLGNTLAAEILEKVTEVEESLATREPAQEAADIPIEARLIISAVTMFKYDAGTQQFAIVSDYGDPDLVRVRYLRPHTVTATEAGDEKQLQYESFWIDRRPFISDLRLPYPEDVQPLFPQLLTTRTNLFSGNGSSEDILIAYRAAFCQISVAPLAPPPRRNSMANLNTRRAFVMNSVALGLMGAGELATLR